MPDSYIIPFPPGAGVSFAPGRIFDPNSSPSGGSGMAGTAPDFVVFLEALRTGGKPILEEQTVKTMTTNQIGDFLIDPESPGWGFGFGAAVLTDPIAAQTPQAVGTFRWGGIYGHSWFVDPELDLHRRCVNEHDARGNGRRFSSRDSRHRLPSAARVSATGYETDRTDGRMGHQRYPPVSSSHLSHRSHPSDP
jgi:hypothetical protein